MKNRTENAPDARPAEPAECELCGREVPLTFHHLIPRAVHRKPRFEKRYSRHEMKQRGIWVCDLCHHGIHTLIPDEKDLAEQYNTKELLLSHDGVVKHVNWVRKQH